MNVLTKVKCVAIISILIVGLVLYNSAAQAANLTWTPTAGGTFNWNNAAAQDNWDPGTAFPNAMDDVANVTSGITANETINLNQVITVGTLNIGDSGGGNTFQSFNIAPAGGSFVFDVSAGNAVLSKTTGNVDTVSANILLNDRLDVTSSSPNGSGTGAGITISGVVSGTQGITKLAGGNNLFLSALNTYTGSTVVSAGILNFNDLNNGGVASSIGTSSSAAANLVLDGGILRNNSATNVNTTDRLFTLTENGGTIDADGFGVQANATTFTNTGAIAFTGSGARTLILDGSTNHLNTLTPILGDGSGGATSLSYVGGGTSLSFNNNVWDLAGANTYTGTTTVSGTGPAGTLRISGSLAQSNIVINSKTFDGSGTLFFNINGGTSDLIDLNGGTLDITGLTLDFNEIGAGATLSSYVLVDYFDGGIFTNNGGPDFFSTVVDLPSGYILFDDVVNSQLLLQQQLNTTPEPSTTVLSLLSLVGLSLLRRRKAQPFLICEWINLGGTEADLMLCCEPQLVNEATIHRSNKDRRTVAF